MRRSPQSYATPDPLAALVAELGDDMPVITINTTPDLPARLYGGNAQEVEVVGLDYTLHLDLEKLPPSGVPVANDGKWTVCWDEALNTYTRVEYSHLPGGAGPIGPAGPTGATGATGAQGPAGATGAQGIQGPAGATGPAGAPGATGPAGPTGATGAAGPPVSDGDKGDIVVTGSGTIWTLDTAVTASITNKVAKGGDTMTGALAITNATAATSQATGALTVTGGLGVGAKIYAGDINAIRSGTAGAYYFGSNITGYLARAGSGAFTLQGGPLNITDATVSTTPATGALIVGGGVGIAGAVNVSNGLYVNGGVAGGYGRVYIDNPGGSFNSSLAFRHAGVDNWEVSQAGTTPNILSLYHPSTTTAWVQIPQTTPSTSTTTGALVVAGGVGVAGRMSVGTLFIGADQIKAPTISTSAPSGGSPGDVWYQVP